MGPWSYGDGSKRPTLNAQRPTPNTETGEESIVLRARLPRRSLGEGGSSSSNWGGIEDENDDEDEKIDAALAALAFNTLMFPPRRRAILRHRLGFRKCELLVGNPELGAGASCCNEQGIRS